MVTLFRSRYSFRWQFDLGGADVPDGQATPEEQINAEVMADQTLHTLAGLFGANFDAQTGGTSTSGAWVFTDLAELDAMIRQWSEVSDELDTRMHKIQRTATIIQPPADDLMSVIQTNSLVGSLGAMVEHVEAMLGYTKTYVKKLQQARGEYAITEQNNTTLFNGSHG
jgi:hypothetical protein